MSFSKPIIVVIIITLIIIIGVSVGYLAQNILSPTFSDLSSDDMYQEIIEERDIAIRKAVDDGVYRCCIDPPCTMCYMEANQWNNGEPGTCLCDDLIAEGKEPCPQCKSGICEGSDSTCSVNRE